MSTFGGGSSEHRLLREARLLATALADPRACFLSKLSTLLGLAYLFVPIDLIPDRIPVVGHFDEAGFILGGLALARRAIPQPWIDRHADARRGSSPDASDGGTIVPGAWRHGALRRLRSTVLDAVIRPLAAPLLRLAIGRWPDGLERRRFREGVRSATTPVPPLLRGLGAVPAAQPQLTRAMLQSWIVADESTRDALRSGLPSAAPPGDLLRVWTKAPVGFLHLEKCAGTSVASLLAAQFHPVQIDPDPNRAYPGHILCAFPPNAAPQLGHYAFVWGHYDLPALRRLGEGRFLLTMLREPRARILSLYRFWRSLDRRFIDLEHANFNVAYAQNLGLLGFLRADVPELVDYLDNFYVRRLTGLYATGEAEDPLAAAPQASLERALAALDSIDFVGITERTTESMARLAQKLDFDPDRQVPLLNVAETNLREHPLAFRRLDEEPLTDEIEAELDRLTELDRVVYEAAVARFDRV